MDEPTPAWRGCRVLVTGCTGFLGAAVVRELLAHGAEVVGLVRDRAADAEVARHKLAGRVHVLHGRVEDTFRLHSALAVHEARAVFHLATADPGRLDRGTATVLEAVRRHDPRVPVVVARPADAPFMAAPPVPVGMARFGELFGSGDRKTFRVVPATILGLVGGDSRPVPDSISRDFVFVRDAARACITLAAALLHRPEPQVTDLSFRSGWRLTERAMAAAVRCVFEGRLSEVPAGAPPANPLDWAPTVSLADALAETVGWYREFLRTRFLGTRPIDPTRKAA